MHPSELRELAAEREARATANAVGPMPNPWLSSSGCSGSASRKPSMALGELARAHRSVRIAHSLGVICACVGLLLLLLVSNRSWGLVVLLAGTIIARAGGYTVHGLLPKLLQEGAAPTEAEVAAGASVGCFCLAGLLEPGTSISQEWTALLENLAFVCTYGKRNCLTSQMYAGDITLGKICSLVSGKLSQGVVRCN
eukprot:TRINITY_DN64031_c0_g1_i1.p2 TRINITY_DN64031_c0_g1~~TRINITY_DN64031_c0_g1_i1.p2  ORF type:complete len:196 (-),score=19.88 TRINITY_DN64031_c0_g1_i1:28-615(-)